MFRRLKPLFIGIQNLEESPESFVQGSLHDFIVKNMIHVLEFKTALIIVLGRWQIKELKQLAKAVFDLRNQNVDRFYIIATSIRCKAFLKERTTNFRNEKTIKKSGNFVEIGPVEFLPPLFNAKHEKARVKLHLPRILHHMPAFLIVVIGADVRHTGVRRRQSD